MFLMYNYIYNNHNKYVIMDGNSSITSHENNQTTNLHRWKSDSPKSRFDRIISRIGVTAMATIGAAALAGGSAMAGLAATGAVVAIGATVAAAAATGGILVVIAIALIVSAVAIAYFQTDWKEYDNEDAAKKMCGELRNQSFNEIFVKASTLKKYGFISPENAEKLIENGNEKKRLICARDINAKAGYSDVALAYNDDLDELNKKNRALLKEIKKDLPFEDESSSLISTADDVYDADTAETDYDDNFILFKNERGM